MFIDTAIESALTRDRFVVLCALAVALGLAWAYLLAGGWVVLAGAA